MELPNPKELKALLKVCREFGVENVEFGSVKLKFGEMPGAVPTSEAQTTAAQPSDEELAYWSSQPDPLATRMDAQ